MFNNTPEILNTLLIRFDWALEAGGDPSQPELLKDWFYLAELGDSQGWVEETQILFLTNSKIRVETFPCFGV